MAEAKKLAEEAAATVTSEVERAINLFFRHLDECDYESLTALMTADGLWHRQGKELRGRAMIMEEMKARPVGFVTRHIVSNFVVDTTGPDHAAASLYITVFAHQAEAGASPPHPMALPNIVGVYRIKALRQADGWRLQEIRSTPVFRRQ
jgi:hypothetical protein